MSPHRAAPKRVLKAKIEKPRGFGTLSEKNVKDALREVRLALLEADRY